jgi:hypothetical protein
MDPKILREAALAYQAVYNEDLREEIEEDQLALNILEEVAYYLISQGCTAIDVLEYFANVDNDIIVDDVTALSEGILLSEEGVVSEEYIKEQTQQLDEIIGAALRLGGAALRAARYAPQGAKLGQRALAGLGGAGRAATRISQQGTRASAVVRPALGRAAQAVRGAVSGARGAVSGAVNKAKDIARGALNKLPGGSGGRLAGAAKLAGKAALGGAAFEGGMRAAGSLANRMGGSKPQTAKPAPTSGAPKPAGGAGNVNVPGKGQRYYASSDKKYYKNYNDALAAKNSRRSAAAKPGSSATMNALNAPGVQNRFIQDKPASSSAPASRPAATAAPASRPAAPSASRPAATAPTSKPSPTASAPAKPSPAPSTPAAKPTKVQQDVADLKAMQTASQERQASPSSKEDQNKRRLGGSAKPGSIVSGFDLFDVVKGYLIDEGFAETEQAAIAIMANMSEEWKLEIIDEAVKGESSDRRRALAAERRKGIKPLSAKEGEKYASHKISQMAYTKRAKMGDDD